MKIEISRNIEISQKGLTHIFSRIFFSDRSRLLVLNARKVDAIIWWVIVKWLPLLGSVGHRWSQPWRNPTWWVSENSLASEIASLAEKPKPGGNLEKTTNPGSTFHPYPTWIVTLADWDNTQKPDIQRLHFCQNFSSKKNLVRFWSPWWKWVFTWWQIFNRDGPGC